MGEHRPGKGGVPDRLSLGAHAESETGGRTSEDKMETRQRGPAGTSSLSAHRPRGAFEKSWNDLKQGHAAPFVRLLSEAVFSFTATSQAPEPHLHSRPLRVSGVMKRGLIIKGGGGSDVT